MERREFIRTCGCCGFAAAAASYLDAFDLPARLQRPDVKTDEGGLWAQLDRAEERLKHSPFLVREAELNGYIHGIACRLAQSHCPDLRTYVVRSPYFNANMAANGMMQVWTGLLLRTQNEAQVAAVLGHEIGHYVSRHSLEQLRDAKSRSAFASLIGVVPVAGTLAAVGLLAGGFAYSREHERTADAIGVELMAAAGYPPLEASRVWGNLLQELAAEKDWSGEPEKRSLLFATHPPTKERQATLLERAQAMGKADLDPGVIPMRRAISPHRYAWLEDELKRRRYGESYALLTRLCADNGEDGEAVYFLGELYRRRNAEGDAELAFRGFQKAAALPGVPPEVHRSLGMLHQKAGRIPEMRAAYTRYLQAKPAAEDAEMIRAYLTEGS
jgi:Zn-dependent protease with chaperone function